MDRDVAIDQERHGQRPPADPEQGRERTDPGAHEPHAPCPGDGHKLKTRLSQGEKRKRKATVYNIERQVRTPGSILDVDGQKEEAADTDAYWTSRTTEELKRNHLSRMASHDFGRVTVPTSF